MNRSSYDSPVPPLSSCRSAHTGPTPPPATSRLVDSRVPRSSSSVRSASVSTDSEATDETATGGAGSLEITNTATAASYSASYSSIRSNASTASAAPSSLGAPVSSRTSGSTSASAEETLPARLPSGVQPTTDVTPSHGSRPFCWRRIACITVTCVSSALYTNPSLPTAPRPSSGIRPVVRASVGTPNHAVAINAITSSGESWRTR